MPDEKIKYINSKDGRIRFFTKEAIKLGGPRRNDFVPAPDNEKRSASKPVAIVHATIDDVEVNIPAIVNEATIPEPLIRKKPGPKKRN